MDNSISLNKFISDTGYCSRREADNLIKAGRVMLNDYVAELGNRYSPGDVVEVDGSLITPDNKEKRVYLALNKPIGITSTTEMQVKGNIISFVNYPKRIFPIGRLDKDSEGLIFLTNDGDIINKILRAGNSHEKEYIVRVNKTVDPHFAQKMSGGLPIMGTRTLPCKVQLINRHTFRIVLTQGLNRQIRRMCEYLGYAVESLQRVRIMDIKLGNLALGKWRHLSEVEVDILKKAVANSSSDARANRPEKKKAGHISGGNKKDNKAQENTRKEKLEEEEISYEDFLKAEAENVRPKKSKSGAWWSSRHGKDDKNAPGSTGKGKDKGGGKPKDDKKRSGPSKGGPGFDKKRSQSGKDRTDAGNKKSAGAKKSSGLNGKRSGPGKGHPNESRGASGKRSGGLAGKTRGRSGRSGR